MIKKIINVALILAMLFNIALPTGAVHAAAPEVVLDITAPATALRGQEVLVNVSVEIVPNTNIQAIDAKFGYSDGFPEIISENTKIVSDTYGFYSKSISNKKLLTIGDVNSAGGTIVGQLAFKIPDNAAFGTVYTVSFSKILISRPDATGLSENEYTVVNHSVSVEVVDLPQVDGISVVEYEGEYDGDEHTISVDIPEGATIKYSSDRTSYTSEIPYYKNAGNHKVYYVVSKEGNSDTYGEGNVKITAKSVDESMIDPISPQQYTGEQIKPDITVTDGSPNIIDESDYDVTYGENINVATKGSVTITGKGNYTGTATKEFEILPSTMEVSEVDYNGIYDGVMHTAQVSVTKPAGAQIKYGTEENNCTQDTIPEYKNAGTYTIYYKATDPNYDDYTGSVKVIIAPKLLADAMVTDIQPYDYTGSQITPSVIVTDEPPCVITENDYSVTYGENINVAVDGGSVTITGQGNYTGNVTKYFDITPIEMTVSKADYSGVYDGNEHSGTVDVQIPSSAVVKYGTQDGEYTLDEMPKYKNVGTYTVYYKATDPNYIDNTGSFEVNITPKTLTDEMLLDIQSCPFTGMQIKPDITVTDEPPCVITENDYSVTYGENINVASGGSVTITGEGNYTGNITKYFDITPIEMTVSKADYSGVYDGHYHSAQYTVTTPSEALVRYGLTEGTYDLDEMPSYKNVGEYTIYYKATYENYIDNVGSVKVTITPKPVTTDMIGDIQSYPYTGAQIAPTISVTDDEPSIITESDYDVTYGENINVSGGGSVTITGKGNYTGAATKRFLITPIDMVASAGGYEGVYDGLNHTVNVVVSEPSSAQIKYGTQEGIYDLNEAPQYVNVGEYTVYYKISADNYNDVTGSLVVKITPKTLTGDMVENITAQEFTGMQITPSVTLRDTLPCVITENDYELTYGPNITVAQGGTVTVTAKGNYEGTVTKYFEIANAIIRVEKSDYTGIFDGQAYSGSVESTNCDAAQFTYGMTEGTYDLTQMPEFTNAGNYVVYFKATCENYSDCTGSIEVNIAPKNLTDEMVSAPQAHTYTSVQITPAVTVTDCELITSEDYDITYGENINVTGDGSVTVTAKRNYTGTVTKTFEITKAELNITSESKEITYGDAFEIPVVYSGFVGAETKANLISEAVLSGYELSPDAGVYDITLSGAQSDNYNITYGTGYTLTVNKKIIQLADLKVFDKAFDDTTDAVINETTAVLTGVLGGDVVIVDLENAVANFATKEAGDGISVTITGLELAGDDGNNYVLDTDTFTTTASIKATITATDIANHITSIVIDKNTTNLVLPTVPEGYTITLKTSSDETIIDSDGTIYTTNAAQNVNLVFTVSNEDGTDTADTISIAATVPAHDEYQITVNTDGNGTVTGSGMYVKNTSATVVATPNSGYTFDGWYEETVKVSSSASYTFNVTGALTLEAKFSQVVSHGGGGFKKKTYIVSFVTNCNLIASSITVNENSKVGRLPKLERDGYIFEGWYTDKALTQLFDESTPVKKSLTLYAKWTEESKPSDEPVEDVTFTDVSDTEWYYDSVKYVVEKGLFKGVSDTEFAPNNLLTRAMIVTVLYRAEGQPEVLSGNSFSDVQNGTYYTDAVKWAAENGIVSGVSDKEFMPDNNITREQIAAIIYRYAKYKGTDVENVTADVKYNDKGQISDWAFDAIKFCKAMNIMTGNDVNEFKPVANATRAEVAATLQRFFEGR